ncbi:FIG01326805: variable size protein family [Amycolatopsis camponoti]|uniref:FIG01326805: variable size protein family n=1 Tax=Amycolatopsis camponoti TaxID=2606593 RepID=A0A6I8LSZ8_9PSEU|nr:IniB N-terminal domain-containing protein [Amycolatopsis camponoti]VVJ19658.1 FIG01326805: variable size protein family [Amycolatopsis camponoti]
MDSVQTLHDFALNLLNDPTALAAFGTDPQGVLAAAGLGDVSAADVHEVIPLVLDFVPVDSLPAVGALPVVGDLSSVGTDAPGIQGAIDQLTALTAGLGLPAVPELPGVGDLGGSLPGVGDLGLPAVPGVGALPGVNDITTTAAGVTALAGDFGTGGDLGSSLDAVQVAGNLVYSVTDTDHSAVVGTVEQAAHLGDAVTNNVSYNAVTPVYEATSQVGDISGDLNHTVSSVVGQVGDFSGILQGAGNLDVSHVTHEVSNVTHGLGDVTSVVTNATGVDVSHNVAGQVGDIASGNTSAVHDVVSDVSDVSHNALGNLHIGDIASNDIHLGH